MINIPELNIGLVKEMLTTLSMEWIEAAEQIFRKTNCFESFGRFPEECT